MYRLGLFLAALWWGGLTALSFLAVPTLFAQMGSPALAGPVAAKLFSLQAFAGLIIGLGLLVILRQERRRVVPELPDGLPELPPAALWKVQQALGTMAIVLLGMLLAMVQEFVVAEKIVMARATGGDLRLWHGVGSGLVFAQWLCAAAVLWRLSGAHGRS